MNTYRVYCPEIPGKPVVDMQGETAFEVRQLYAMQNRVAVVEVVSLRVSPPLPKVGNGRDR